MILTAHEIRCGIGEDYWEVYDESFDMPFIISPDDMGEFINTTLKEGNELYINTYESWVAMDAYL